MSTEPRSARFDEGSRKVEIETTSSRANSVKTESRFSDNFSGKSVGVSGKVTIPAGLEERLKSAHNSIGKVTTSTSDKALTPPPAPATAASTTKGTSLMGKFNNLFHGKH